MEPMNHENNDHQIENGQKTTDEQITPLDIPNDENPPAEEQQAKAPVAEEASADESRAEEHRTEGGPTSGASFGGNASPDGTGYSTPNGGHGYAYAPKNPKASRMQRTRRAVLLAVAGIVACVLLVGVGVLGTWSMVSDFYNEYAAGRSEENESEYGTCGELQIDEGQSSSGSGNVSSGLNNTGDKDTTRPSVDATISKREPSRVDADGNGHPDIAYDQNGQVLTSANGAVDTTATVVAKVADSVVEIFTETVQSDWYGQYVTDGAGSGVIISPEGHIVTNHHVIEGAKSITVRLTDGTEYNATLIAADEQADVAVLWIDAGDRTLTVAKLGASYDLVVGEEIIAIGNPMGSLGGTVTYGKISATAREIAVGNSLMTLLQVDAPINPGNSGGALFNMAGELVGIVNAKMSDEDIEGLGFAIPIDTAYDVILDLMAYGYVTGRPYMGLSLANVQNRYTGQYYVQIKESLYTDDLQANDLILKIDGVTVSTTSDISLLLSRYQAGDTVELLIGRNNQELTITLTLREYRPADAS